MRLYQRLKDQLIDGDVIDAINIFIQEKEIHWDIEWAPQAFYSTLKQRSGNILNLAIETNMNGFVELTKAICRLSPTIVLRETSRTPLVYFIHLSRPGRADASPYSAASVDEL